MYTKNEYEVYFIAVKENSVTQLVMQHAQFVENW